MCTIDFKWLYTPLLVSEVRTPPTQLPSKNSDAHFFERLNWFVRDSESGTRLLSKLSQNFISLLLDDFGWRDPRMCPDLFLDLVQLNQKSI